MNIITTSHIDEAHAAGPHFPLAHSEDGRFHWHSLSRSYVSIVMPDGSEHTVYLPHGNLDTAVSPELLAEAREFMRAVDDLKTQRKKDRDRADTEKIRKETDAFIAARDGNPALQKALAAYGSSERAWAAEDESAWALLNRWGL